MEQLAIHVANRIVQDWKHTRQGFFPRFIVDLLTCCIGEPVSTGASDSCSWLTALALSLCFCNPSSPPFDILGIQRWVSALPSIQQSGYLSYHTLSVRWN